jgi:hypothetical protein
MLSGPAVVLGHSDFIPPCPMPRLRTPLLWVDDRVDDQLPATATTARINGLAVRLLRLHPDKTRLIEFGRRAAIDRRRRGLGKPETFDFLGFTHICARARSGRFWVRRITIAKRMRAKLAEVKTQLRRRMHDPIPVQGRWLARVLQGHVAYYAVPGNSNAVSAFRYQVSLHWRRTLRRRSQRGRITWARMGRYATRWLPQVRVMHPYPNVRFAART